MSLTTNLVSYYKLDSNSNDAVGSNNGTDTSMTYDSADGKISNGGKFNGTSSSIQLPNVTLGISTAYTIAAWIKTSTVTTSPMIMNRDSGATPVNRNFQFLIKTNGTVEFIRFNTSNVLVTDITTTTTVNDGNWHHVVAWFDNATGSKIYIDKVSSASDAVLTNNNDITGITPVIGAGHNGNPTILNFFNGSIDELGLWSRGLTQTEINELYNGGTGLQYPFSPTVTTQAESSILSLSATANGNITSISGVTCIARGVVYGTTSYGDPGDTAPGSTSYSNSITENGSFSTGAFTESMTGLSRNVTYYVRAWAYNGAYGYGGEVSFTTAQFTNPGNIYASDDTYATLPATSGDLTVEISKDGGTNYQSALVKTFTGSDTLLTYGNGSTELWGATWVRSDMINANLRIRLSQGGISQVYKNFGFATGTETLTGIEVAIEGNYAAATLSLDLLKVRIYYGTSILPVQAGSMAYASDAGLGSLAVYNGSNWTVVDPDIVQSLNTITGNETIGTTSNGYTSYISDTFEIASGIILDILSGSVFEIG